MKAQLRTPAIYGLCAAFAAATAAVTHLPPHRTWGAIAAAAYASTAVAALTPRLRRRPGLLAAAGFAGAALLPLAVLVADGSAQPEVGVVERSAAHLLGHGIPYRVPGAGEGYEAYNPYLPAMALLGLPSALIGLDARVVFTAVFLALFAPSALLLRGRAALAPLTLVAASPLVALSLAVGGDDLPVLGLACLGLALAARAHPAAAGAVLGLAAAMKPTAWPVLLACLAFLVHRHGTGGLLSGRRLARARLAAGAGAFALAAFVLDAAWCTLAAVVVASAWIAARSGVVGRFAGAAGGVLAVGVVPPLLVDPRAFLVNAVQFPMGLAGVGSPADSPLPGRLLADLGTGGHAVALVALGVAALAMGASLVVRPPADVRAAALRVAVGFTLATALMPASRWGYLVYPAVLLLWARIAARPDVRKEDALCLAA